MAAQKAKAGLCLLYEKWFSDYVNEPTNAEKGQELKNFIEKDSAAVIAELHTYFDLVYPGPMVSVADAEIAIAHFRESGIDLLIVVSLFWSGDKPLIKTIQAFPHLPVLLWCYAPTTTLPEKMGMNDLFRAGGIVGAMQTSAPLRKMNKKICFVYGTPGDEALALELAEYGRAFGAKKAMQGLRLGHIGGRYEEMTGTYADEFFLLGKLGVALVPISALRLSKAADALSEAEVQDYIGWLKGRCVSVGVSDDALYCAARASLAVARVAQEEKLGALALEDFNDEMHHLLRTRPQLWVPTLDQLRLVPSMEGDVLAALALWISCQLGDTLPMYTEMFAFDQARNSILMGHAAMNCLDIAGDNPVSIIPDAECGTLDESEGAWLHFKGREGNVTVASLFDTGGGQYRATTFSGKAVYSNLLSTSPNVLVQMDIPLRSFYQKMITTGMTQHFALSYDATKRGWEKFCEVTGIDFLPIAE